MNLLATRAAKYECTIRRVRRQCFDYDDAQLAKAHRVIQRMARIIRRHHEATVPVDQWGATAHDRAMLARHGIAWGD